MSEGKVMPKKLLCCKDCGSDDIAFRVWAEEDGTVVGDCEDFTCFCNECSEETRFTSKENL